MKLRDVLESNENAKVKLEEQKADREAERVRIREKLSDTDREFMDQIKDTFPGSRMVAIKFSDGESIGRW